MRPATRIPFASDVLVARAGGRLTVAPSPRRLACELGVVFLLFTLGLEFSFPRMLAMRHEVFGLGAAQVGLTTAAFAILARILGLPWLTALVVGGGMSMSSTALLLHLLKDGEIAIDTTDEIQAGVVVTHAGEVVHPLVHMALNAKASGEV